jgi:hypothetical protein
LFLDQWSASDDGERLARPTFALAQAPHRCFAAGIDEQLESAKAFESNDLPTAQRMRHCRKTTISGLKLVPPGRRAERVAGQPEPP